MLKEISDKWGTLIFDDFLYCQLKKPATLQRCYESSILRHFGNIIFCWLTAPRLLENPLCRQETKISDFQGNRLLEKY